MADFKLFTVGNADYTGKVKQTEYDVHRDDVTENWVDGNHRTRSSLIRTRVSGSIKLNLKKSEYNQFLTDMQNAKDTATNTYAIAVHPNNLTTGTELVSINALCTVSSEVAYGTESRGYHPAAMYVTVDFEEW